MYGHANFNGNISGQFDLKLSLMFAQYISHRQRETEHWILDFTSLTPLTLCFASVAWASFPSTVLDFYLVGSL